MSRTFNMVGGGGENVATLAVTVTNGTATSVVATKGSDIVSLSYSGGTWNTVLPSFGAWTVTITDGTHANSATVNASTAGLYSVSIFMPDVPSAYTQLEYLQSSGTQYINTGLDISGGGEIKVKFAWPSGHQPAQNNAILGLQIKGSPYNNVLLRYQSQSSNTIRCAMYGLSVDTSYQAGRNYDADIVFDSTSKTLTVMFNGTTTTRTGGTRIIANLALFLFCINQAGNPDAYSQSKIYAFEYTPANSVIPSAKYYPARRNSDSVLGMYDIETNTFKTNSGTGTFIAGPAV